MILVDRDRVATWRTVVTDLVAIPFEHVTAALDELRRRWDIQPIWNGPVVSPGMLVAWRASPTGYLDRPVPVAADLAGFVCERCGDEEIRRWLKTLPPSTGDRQPPGA